jgi:hypothetical protein
MDQNIKVYPEMTCYYFQRKEVDRGDIQAE